MRILLVTDEERLLRQFENIISAHFLPDSVCLYTARTISSACQTAEQEKVDVALVDIAFSGAVELMEELKRLSPCCMLYSLADGFGALKRLESMLRVPLDGYFLKQADSSFLVEAIQQIVDERQHELMLRQYQSDFQRKLETEKPWLFENFIRDLLGGAADDARLVADTGAYLKEYIQTDDSFFVVAIRPVERSERAEEHFARMLLLRDDVKKWMPTVNKASLMYHKYIVLLLSVAAWREIPNAQFLLEYGLRSHIAAFERKWGIRISVGTSRECEGMMSLRTAYLQAKAAAKWGMTHEDMLPLILFSDYASNSGVSILIDHHMIEELIEAQADADSQTIRTIMLRHLAQIPLTGRREPEYISRIRMDVTAVLMLAASSLSVPLDAQQISFLMNQSDFSTVNELVDWFVSQTQKITEYRKNTAIRKEKMLVEHAKKLVCQEASHHFTTQEMALRLGIGVNYFGSMFKRCEGISFLEYVTNQSLLKAVALLSNPQLRLNEVSMMVGFDDANYFARVFKKHYGCTPSQFRNRVK